MLTEKIEHLKTQKDKLNKLCIEVHKLINNTPSKTHIIPIIIGSNEDTLKLTEKLKAEGYYIPAIRPPTVPVGSSRLRISLTANTDLKDIENVLKIIRES